MSRGGASSLGASSPTNDRASFASLYEAELTSLVRLAFVVCGSVATAEDIVADAVVKVWRRWHKDNIERPGPYLRRAVVNELIATDRRNRLHERRRAWLAVTDVVVAEDAIADRRLLWDALRTLPVEQRTAIAVRYLLDLSEAQTAEMLGVPLGTVKSRVSRGLAQLSVELSEVGHGA